MKRLAILGVCVSVGIVSFVAFRLVEKPHDETQSSGPTSLPATQTATPTQKGASKQAIRAALTKDVSQKDEKIDEDQWNIEIVENMTWNKIEGPLLNSYVDIPVNRLGAEALDFFSRHEELRSHLPPGSELSVEKVVETVACNVASIGARIGNIPTPGRMTFAICPKSKTMWAKNDMLPVETVDRCPNGSVSPDVAKHEIETTQSPLGHIEVSKVEELYDYGPERSLHPMFGVVFTVLLQNKKNQVVRLGLVDACTGKLSSVPRDVSER